MATTLQPSRTEVPTRDVATRLLVASARHSFDPDTEIDWEAPLADGKPFEPLHRCSLYGTALFDRMTEQQRIQLTKHEVASIASVGIWFENVLIHLMARDIYDRDPTTPRVQYALTEMGDECRHSVMFARMIAKLGCPPYGPGVLTHSLGRPRGEWAWEGTVGDRVTVRLDRDGIYPFFCYAHPGMVGVVVAGDGRGVGTGVVEVAGAQPAPAEAAGPAARPAPAGREASTFPVAWLVLVAWSPWSARPPAPGSSRGARPERRQPCRPVSPGQAETQGGRRARSGARSGRR